MPRVSIIMILYNGEVTLRETLERVFAQTISDLELIIRDDLWLPNKLAVQIAAAEKDPELGFVYGRAVRFFPNGTAIDYDHRHEFGPLPEGNIFEELFVNSCIIAMSSVLFRRSALTAAVAATPFEEHDTYERSAHAT